MHHDAGSGRRRGHHALAAAAGQAVLPIEGFGQDRAPLPLQIGALLQGAQISRAHQDRRRVEHGVVPEVRYDLPAGRGGSPGARPE